MLAQKTVITSRQPSAFSKIRQRKDRNKKVQIENPVPTAMYFHSTPAMMAPTLAQATPRTAQYNRTPASSTASAPDHQRPRGFIAAWSRRYERRWSNSGMAVWGMFKERPADRHS